MAGDETQTEVSDAWNILNHMRKIIVLPSDDKETKLHDSVSDQFQSFIAFVNLKINEYQEKIQESVFIFAMNYVQNRVIANEFCLEMADLFEILQVRRVDDFQFNLDAMRSDESTSQLVADLDVSIAKWDAFMEEIDKMLDEKLGPMTKHPTETEMMKMGNSPISYFVRDSVYDLLLITVVRSFSSSEVNEYVLQLYNKIEDFHKQGCDVHLFTKGPSGVKGGSFLKLIGVPFRKLYDEQAAINELKERRASAKRLAGWKALLEQVEASATEESRAKTQMSTTRDDTRSNADDANIFVSSVGGCIIIDKSGKILYKYVEDEEKPNWPKVDELIEQVKKCPGGGEVKEDKSPNTRRASAAPAVAPITNNKVDSEVSAAAPSNDASKEKSCCTIL